MSDLKTYPNGPGFQSHSSTSREAAAKNTSAGAQRDHVEAFIARGGRYGATTDEVRNYLLDKRLIHKNSIMSARVRELELSGRIVKTTMKRKTLAGRQANVYVSRDIFYAGGFQKDVKKPANTPSCDCVKYRRVLQNIKERMAMTGYGAEHRIIVEWVNDALGDNQI